MTAPLPEFETITWNYQCPECNKIVLVKDFIHAHCCPYCKVLVNLLECESDSDLVTRKSVKAREQAIVQKLKLIHDILDNNSCQQLMDLIKELEK